MNGVKPNKKFRIPIPGFRKDAKKRSQANLGMVPDGDRSLSDDDQRAKTTESERTPKTTSITTNTSGNDSDVVSNRKPPEAPLKPVRRNKKSSPNKESDTSFESNAEETSSIKFSNNTLFSSEDSGEQANQANIPVMVTEMCVSNDSVRNKELNDSSIIRSNVEPPKPLVNVVKHTKPQLLVKPYINFPGPTPSSYPTPGSTRYPYENTSSATGMHTLHTENYNSSQSSSSASSFQMNTSLQMTDSTNNQYENDIVESRRHTTNTASLQQPPSREDLSDMGSPPRHAFRGIDDGYLTLLPQQLRQPIHIYLNNPEQFEPERLYRLQLANSTYILSISALQQNELPQPARPRNHSNHRGNNMVANPCLRRPSTTIRLSTGMYLTIRETFRETRPLSVSSELNQDALQYIPIDNSLPEESCETHQREQGAVGPPITVEQSNASYSHSHNNVNNPSYVDEERIYDPSWMYLTCGALNRTNQTVNNLPETREPTVERGNNRCLHRDMDLAIASSEGPPNQLQLHSPHHNGLYSLQRDPQRNHQGCYNLDENRSIPDYPYSRCDSEQFVSESTDSALTSVSHINSSDESDDEPDIPFQRYHSQQEANNIPEPSLEQRNSNHNTDADSTSGLHECSHVTSTPVLITPGFASLSTIPADVSMLTVRQVVRCLKLLSLDRHEDVVMKQSIDGSLASQISEDMLINDLCFTKFEAFKFIQFMQKAWRPKVE